MTGVRMVLVLPLRSDNATRSSGVSSVTIIPSVEAVIGGRLKAHVLFGSIASASRIDAGVTKTDPRLRRSPMGSIQDVEYGRSTASRADGLKPVQPTVHDRCTAGMPI